MHYQWNWMLFGKGDAEGSLTFFDTLLSGLCFTLVTAALAWIIALLIGTLIGTLRTTSHKAVVQLTGIYLALFRHFPLLIQMFLWYFAMPQLLPAEWGNCVRNLQSTPIIAGIICLAFYTSARIAILVSHGIHYVLKQQPITDKADESSLNHSARFKVLAAALRLIMPLLANEAATSIKNSSVALTAGLLELSAGARNLSEFSFLTLEAIIAATLIYIAVSAIEIATECLTCVDASRFYR